jgi:hypothetical protein
MGGFQKTTCNFCAIPRNAGIRQDIAVRDVSNLF